MARNYRHPIQILKADEAEDFKPLYSLHAYINKPRQDDEYLRAGAIQSRRYLRFEVRYFPGLKDIFVSQQLYRIRYDGVDYNITSLDDFRLQHRTVAMIGESCG